jgi:histidine triad (HIT) family protein
MASEEAELQEKLKNMSPEELKQFQIQNCIFCHIVKGKVASKKVYEDDKCLAILDINPANPGHILLMPKEHYSIMPLIPEDIIEHLFMISKHLSSALLKVLNKDFKNVNTDSIGTNIFVANGAAAGQKAQHFMVHIIPRMEKDGLNLELETKKISEKELEELRIVLSAKIAKDLGIKAPEEPKKEEIKVERMEKEPKVVEAEFIEKKEDKKPEKKSEKKKSKPKKEKSAKTKDEKVTLDDIADLVTGAK